MRTLRRAPGQTRLSRFRARVIALALLLGGSLAVRGAADTDADLQLQLATLLFDETRYQEALQAFDQAAQSTNAQLAIRARKGTVRTSLKVAEFGRARSDRALWRRVLVGRTLRRGRSRLPRFAGTVPRFLSGALRCRAFTRGDQPSQRSPRHDARRLGHGTARR